MTSHYKTPTKLKPKEQLFKTPMSFSPRLDGVRAKPSPSRMDLWKQELGLDDTQLDTGATSESDSDEENTDPVLKSDQGSTCSFLEYKALQHELQERNAQRDELLFQVKTLTDRNKQYKQWLEKEESNKKQQLRIMRKTHEAHLQEKQRLIRNLKDIIEEQEARILSLEAEISGNPAEKTEEGVTNGVSSLVEQVESLQTQIAEHTRQILQQEGQTEDTQHQEELSKLREANQKLEQEKNNMQDEIYQLQSEKSNGSTDTEKQLHKCEVEITNLQQVLKNKCRERDEVAAMNQNLKETNQQLSQRISALESQVSGPMVGHQGQGEEEARLSEQVTALKKENQVISRENRALRAELAALQAKSPEVVRKIERIEVESERSKEELNRSQKALDKITLEKIQLEKTAKEVEQKLILTLQQLAEAHSKIQDLEHHAAEEARLAEHVSLLEKDKQQSADKILALQGQVESFTELVEQSEQELTAFREKSSAQISQLKRQHRDELANLHQEKEQEIKEKCRNLDIVKAKLSALAPGVWDLTHDYKTLKEECVNFPRILQAAVQNTTLQVCESIRDISDHNQSLVKKYHREMQLRKKFHNELVELRGNIRVFCRVRPPITEDGKGPSAAVIVHPDVDDDGVVMVNYKSREQSFDVDRVFSASSSQEEVYNEVQSLVTSCIDGFHVCIFAYGQTGSGKTYTMEGTFEDPGINQRALRQLFLDTQERGDWHFIITVSVMEIYNEIVRDLLSSDPLNKMEVKMNPEGGLHVPGLTSIEVTCLEQLNQVFQLGKESRATAYTNMNEHSSRSHALLCVNVHGTNVITGAKVAGKLNLVDLAGSERVSKSGADGARLKEAQNINRSLSCLGDVIHALRGKQTHVPYRNSKLTYLLQDSLGGESKTLMIVQVAPVEKNAGETVASLNFAQRVRAVELGQASRKVTEGTEQPGKHKIDSGTVMVGDSSRLPAKMSATPAKQNRMK